MLEGVQKAGSDYTYSVRRYSIHEKYLVLQHWQIRGSQRVFGVRKCQGLQSCLSWLFRESYWSFGPESLASYGPGCCRTGLSRTYAGRPPKIRFVRLIERCFVRTFITFALFVIWVVCTLDSRCWDSLCELFKHALKWACWLYVRTKDMLHIWALNNARDAAVVSSMPLQIKKRKFTYYSHVRRKSVPSSARLWHQYDLILNRHFDPLSSVPVHQDTNLCFNLQAIQKYDQS
jgi:hypothetical protein